jgi:hypothetical protein
MLVRHTTNPHRKTMLPRLKGGSAAMLLLMPLALFGCDVDWANNDTQEPFPRDIHSLRPPPEGERVAVSRFPKPMDEQPLAFNHAIHAGAVEDGGMGMDCQYCHYVARDSIHAGVPASQVCEGCHKQISTEGRPVLQELKAYLDSGEPIPWVKVHDLPDFVHFNHSAHIGADIACQECHGEMQTKGVAHQENTLEMGWCLNCHKNHPSVDENYGTQASLRRAELKDCWTCHK